MRRNPSVGLTKNTGDRSTGGQEVGDVADAGKPAPFDRVMQRTLNPDRFRNAAAAFASPNAESVGCSRATVSLRAEQGRHASRRLRRARRGHRGGERDGEHGVTAMSSGRFLDYVS